MNIVVDTRACRYATNPEANVTFDVRGKKRVKESKYANFSFFVRFFYISRLLFVYPSRVWFPELSVTDTLCVIQFATLAC